MRATVRCESLDEAMAFCRYLAECGKPPCFAPHKGFAVECATTQLNLDLLYREFQRTRKAGE